MATDINSVTIVGRLTKDAELKYTNSGSAVTSGSIAVNRSKKNGDNWEEEANFFEFSLWGRRGESLNQYLTKGTRIAVSGELRQDRWEQDGQKRSKVTINANNIQLLGSPQDGSNNSQNNNSGNNNQRNSNGNQNGNPSSSQQHNRPTYNSGNNNQNNNQGNNNQNNQSNNNQNYNSQGNNNTAKFDDDIPF